MSSRSLSAPTNSSAAATILSNSSRHLAAAASQRTYLGFCFCAISASQLLLSLLRLHATSRRSGDVRFRASRPSARVGRRVELAVVANQSVLPTTRCFDRELSYHEVPIDLTLIAERDLHTAGAVLLDRVRLHISQAGRDRVGEPSAEVPAVCVPVRVVLLDAGALAPTPVRMSSEVTSLVGRHIGMPSVLLHERGDLQPVPASLLEGSEVLLISLVRIVLGPDLLDELSHEAGEQKREPTQVRLRTDHRHGV